MPSPHIPRALRARVAAQGRHRCGYCLTQETVVGVPMEIDHIVPTSLDGPTIEENLWLACSSCNEYKGAQVTGRDPETESIANLFNPREQSWSEHFVWTRRGDRVVGMTPTGRATIAILRLNRPLLVQARRRWVTAGWHPPSD